VSGGSETLLQDVQVFNKNDSTQYVD